MRAINSADTRRSRFRTAHRRRYEQYINSEAWFAFRERWFTWYTQTNQQPPQCACCSRILPTRKLDLHHVDYERLGAELVGDVIALCRTCHSAIHTLIDRQRMLKYVDLATATRIIIDHLQAELARARNDGTLS